MNEINGLTKERLKKLESIRAMGFDPFGGKFLKECLIADLCEYKAKTRDE